MCDPTQASFSDLVKIAQQLESLGRLLRSWRGLESADVLPEIPGIGLILEDCAEKLVWIHEACEDSETTEA